MGAFDSFHEWRERRAELGLEAPVHFVPTMGALHDGHGALIREAREAAGESGHVVVSVYVNPTQFNEVGDLEAYPRTRNADLVLAEGAGADAVVFPASEEMYPEGVPERPLSVDFGAVTTMWEAAHRPGHFDGVVAVVRTLFHATAPVAAYFGEKDWQQLAVIRVLANREFPELDIVAVPTVREPDGLAMSSRNARLVTADREGAAALFAALRRVVEAGGDAGIVERERAWLEARGFTVEYLAVVDEASLQSEAPQGCPRRAIVAARWGGVRLIDNLGLRT